MQQNNNQIEQIDLTIEALEKIQNFDVNSLVREKELGDKFNFLSIKESASRLVELYSKLSKKSLQDFSERILKSIGKRAEEDYKKFLDVLDFDPIAADAVRTRERLIDSLQIAYDETFDILHPYITYSIYRLTDFQSLKSDAEQALNKLQNNANERLEEIDRIKSDTTDVLEQVRQAAAEQGVSQQAIYFKSAADGHKKESDTWVHWIIGISIALIVYSIVSLFLHKIPLLAVSNLHETIQLSVSKAMIFGVLSYALYICTRNYLSHKHNQIVNFHRQNALMTYKALVEAAGDESNPDLVLYQAAACIFTPQSSGYAADKLAEPASKSVIELLTKSMKPDDS